MSQYGADHIYSRIANAAAKGSRLNLGLATGNTMLEIYRILAEKLRGSRVRLDKLTTFNLDEYTGEDNRLIPESHPLSYKKYMRENFFNLLSPELGFDEKRARFPDPVDPARFDREIEDAGGIDFQLLGIGFNGHIAFNEPESPDKISMAEFADLPSRVINLKPLTVSTNAKLTADGKLGAVPHRAATMGMRQILAAREILLLACFHEQSEPLQKMRQGVRSTTLPASFLLDHHNTTITYTSDVIKLD